MVASARSVHRGRSAPERQRHEQINAAGRDGTSGKYPRADRRVWLRQYVLTP